MEYICIFSHEQIYWFFFYFLPPTPNPSPAVVEVPFVSVLYYNCQIAYRNYINPLAVPSN